jgi:MFS family permease
VLPALFIVGVVLFANGAPLFSAERLVPIIGAYVIFGVIFSSICNLIWSTPTSWHWGFWISIPAFVSIGLLENVSAQECRDCGELWFSIETMRQIEEAVKQKRPPFRKIEVPLYDLVESVTAKKVRNE